MEIVKEVCVESFEDAVLAEAAVQKEITNLGVRGAVYKTAPATAFF